ncbi:hypothetical protein D3C81_1697170 [compost metagenome]
MGTINTKGEPSTIIAILPSSKLESTTSGRSVFCTEGNGENGESSINSSINPESITASIRMPLTLLRTSSRMESFAIPSMYVMTTFVRDNVPRVSNSLFNLELFILRRSRLMFVCKDSVNPSRGPRTTDSVSGSEICRCSKFLRSASKTWSSPDVRIAAYPFRIS